MPESRPHVVILGGGFGGLAAARALRRAPVRVTLVDRRNHHLFQPLLYQVATAALNPSDIAHPLRASLRRQKNARVILGRAVRIDPQRKQMILSDGVVDYDYLIVATGVENHYFGNDDWAPHAPGLKSIEDALEIRRRVLLAYEAAEREADEGAVRQWLTFAVVGGGPTGVELAGALAEIGHHALVSDFRTFDSSVARVVLIEGGERILSSYAPSLSEKAARQLSELGVDVVTNRRVESIDEGGVVFTGGERLEARTVLWAAGVTASPIGATLGAPLDRRGRVEVEADLSVPEHPEIFVIGDLAGTADGDPLPQIAPVAVQGGEHVVRCIRDDLRGRERKPFHYRDKGAMATIGRGAAIVEYGRLRLSGFLAWCMWMAVHIFFLIGFKRRLGVMLSWAWSYLTFRRGARLITGTEDRLLPPAPVIDAVADSAKELPAAAPTDDAETLAETTG